MSRLMRIVLSGRTLFLAWAVVLTCTAHGAAAAEVVGTAYSLLLRSPPLPASAAYNPPTAPQRLDRRRLPYPVPARAEMPASSGGLVRLVDDRTGGDIARGRYDAQLRGYFFELPMSGIPGQVCLVLKDPVGRSLPVRDERRGDDGYGFRNPLWEQELARLAQMQLLQSDAASAQQKLAAYQQELNPLQPAPGSPPQACALGSPQPDPPRPVAALEASQAQALAGGVCAMQWDARLRVGRQALAGLYADAGLEADLAEVDLAVPLARALADLSLAVNGEDLTFITDAAQKGKRYLQHAQGIERFRQITQGCKAEVLQRTRREQAAWEQQLQAARNAPQRALQACEARGQRATELAARITTGERYLAEIDKRLRNLAAQSPAASDSQDVAQRPCAAQ